MSYKQYEIITIVIEMIEITMVVKYLSLFIL